MLGKRLNPAADADKCGFKRLSREMKPRQPQMIGVAKFGSAQAAGVERLQKLVVTQMSCGKHQRHKPIMADLELIAVDLKP